MSWLVLLVEDDDDIRDTLMSVLQARGFQVLAACNGRDALDQVRARGARPAVVLLDLLMPVMDGETFLAEQQLDPLLAHVPVVIMTAQLHTPESLPPNVVAMFMKPIRLAEILDAVRRACDAGRVVPPPLATGTGRLEELVEPAAVVVTPDPPADPVVTLAATEDTRPGSDPGCTSD